MPTVRVTRRVQFSAGHRLYNPAWSEEKNRELFGPCSNPSGHGHNYDLEVTVDGDIDPGTGYVMNLKSLRDLLQRVIVRDVDHANLNVDVEWLRDVIPTAENLAVRIWQRLEPRLDGARLVAVRIRETERNYVEYRGE